MKDIFLYEAIKRFDFDQGHTPDPGKSFIDKIVLANYGWDYEYAKMVIDEYKKFIYLAAVYGKVAPPDPIDQIWHQHILYTKDYFNFCQSLFGKSIHHSPDRYIGASSNAYNNTIELYKSEFGFDPLSLYPEIWSLNQKDYKRTDLNKNFVLPKGSPKNTLRLFFYQIFNH